MQVVYTEWAFGRDRRLLQKFAEICLLHNLQVCDCLSLAELNRTFFAIAGKSADQYEAFVQLLDEAFETLDLNRLPSPVPRLGALDLVEITPPDNVLAMGLAQLLVLRDVPVLFGEGMSSQLRDGEHLALRERGFGGMIEAAILPDFGPTTTHPRLGTTTFAASEPSVRFTIRLPDIGSHELAGVVRAIESRRVEGDPDYLGIRMKAYPTSGASALLIFHSELPGLIEIDSLVQQVEKLLTKSEIRFEKPAALGAVTFEQLTGCLRLIVRPEQKV